MNLYAALNLDRTATPAAVKAAYRKAAKRSHPDSPTGSPQKWAAVLTALAVLSDPQRKKLYDETGTIAEPPPDNDAAEALNFALQTIDATIERAAQMYGQADRCDIIADAKTGIRNAIAQLVGEIDKATRNVERMRNLATRFSAKGGKTNRITPMLEAKATGLAQGVASAEKRKRIGEMALAILDDHRFNYVGG